MYFCVRMHTFFCIIAIKTNEVFYSVCLKNNLFSVPYEIQYHTRQIIVICESRGGRKVRLIYLPIPIRSSDCIGRYNRLMPSSDFCIGRLYRFVLSSDSLIDRSCFLVLSSDFCIVRLCRTVLSKKIALPILRKTPVGNMMILYYLTSYLYRFTTHDHLHCVKYSMYMRSP